MTLDPNRPPPPLALIRSGYTPNYTQRRGTILSVKPFLKSLLVFGFLFFAAGPTQAVRPVYHYHALVAGEGTPGYADGPFDQARFNNPQGLTQSLDGNYLIVADTGNNLIRLIDLAHDNRVATLAGTGQVGDQDGPALKASFSQPTALVTLKDGRILVDDLGNIRLRVIDLKAKTVSTFASDSDKGEIPHVSVASITHMLYVESENALYLSQPDFGLLQRLDLSKKTETMLLKTDPRVPNPWALGYYGGKVYVSDRSLPQIYTIDGEPSGEPDKPVTPLTEAGKGVHTVAFAADTDGLYAVESEQTNPLIEIAPYPSPVPQISIAGDPLDERSDTLFSENYYWGLVGFIADRRGNRNFFVENPNHNLVGSFRGLGFNLLLNSELANEGGVTDFNYPYPKPPHTFRILTVEDSHSFHTTAVDHKHHGVEQHNRMEILPKRLELVLNTWAALEDVEMNYEVIHLGKVSWDPLTTWPVYAVPEIVKKYDIDMVLWLIPPGNYTSSFYDRPLTADGIPASETDPEYSLKPLEERVPPGDPALLFKLCKEKKFNSFFVPESGNTLDFGAVSANPVIFPVLERLVAKPVMVLKNKLEGMKTNGGKGVQLEICFLPLGGIGPQQDYERFWEKLCKDHSIILLDLDKPFTALRPTFSPISEVGGNDHFDADGHLLMGILLARELVAQKAIPFPKD